MSRERIVELAKLEIGTKENPPGSNIVKYSKWFGLPGKAWCGMFVSWVFAQAGIPLPKIGYTKGFAGCQTAVADAKKWGRIVTNPLPGDVAFFDWNGDGRFEHTGIFVKNNGGGMFQCVEGNTAFGNDSNGGEVMLRERWYKNAIFIRPNVLEPIV